MSPLPSSIPLSDETASLIYKALRLDGFFPEFKSEHAQKVFPRSGLFLYAREAPVVVQGESGRDVFIVLSGKVSINRVFGDAGASLGHLGPGDLFGEIALLQDGARTATATAETESRIYRLVYDDIQYLLKHNPALAEHLKQLACSRLAQQ